MSALRKSGGQFTAERSTPRRGTKSGSFLPDGVRLLLAGIGLLVLAFGAAAAVLCDRLKNKAAKRRDDDESRS